MSSTTAKFPVPVFRFKVRFSNLGQDIAFQEVSGIKATIEYEDVNGGGEPSSLYKIPTKVKYGEVTFKKGLFKDSSTLKTLIEQFKMNDDEFLNQNVNFDSIIITLLDTTGATVITWELQNVYPISWEFSALNAMQNEIMLENLQVTYSKLVIR